MLIKMKKTIKYSMIVIVFLVSTFFASGALFADFEFQWESIYYPFNTTFNFTENVTFHAKAFNIFSPVNIVGNLTADIIRGEMFEDDEAGFVIDLILVDVWENITNLNPVLLNGFTFTDNGLISDFRGIYKVTTSLSFSGISNSIIVSGVSINGVPQENVRAYSTVEVGGALGNMGGKGFITLEENDVVNFQVRTINSPVKDITVVHADLSLVRVGN